MDDWKNFMAAIVLSMLVLFAYQTFFVEPVDEQALQQQQEDLSIEGVEIPGAEEVPEPIASETAEPPVQIEVEPIRIDAARIRGTISPLGARIDEVILKDYFDKLGEGAENIVVLEPETRSTGYYGEFGWISRKSEGVKVPDANTVWQTSGGTLTSDNEVELFWDNGEGLVFRKFISIDENFMFTIRQVVENTSGENVRLAPYGMVRRLGTPDILGFFILHEGPLGVFNEKLEELDYEELRDDGPANFSTKGGWLGFTDKYWMTALVPDQNNTVNARFLYRSPEGADRYQVDYVSGEIAVANGGSAEYVTHFFAGAKEVQLIDAYEKELNIPLFDRTIDWGRFYFLTKPLFYILDFFFGVFGNFGVAILLLTVLIKLLLFPLANKSYRSMSKMKKLQPKMQKLKERYGDDKLKMQQETMALYQKEKVNPAGGCLPMLIQIPIFFALYKTLFVTIEMRHQPFFGWIHDLSAPDPLTIITGFGLFQWDYPGLLSFLAIGIWPIIMGISMWVQMKLNPSSPDPIQAKIFALMPIFFTFILARFPVGLVIYWTWNNILTIAQQWVIMRQEGVKISDG